MRDPIVVGIGASASLCENQRASSSSYSFARLQEPGQRRIYGRGEPRLPAEKARFAVDCEHSKDRAGTLEAYGPASFAVAPPAGRRSFRAP